MTLHTRKLYRRFVVLPAIIYTHTSDDCGWRFAWLWFLVHLDLTKSRAELIVGEFARLNPHFFQ
jgi:hypothetical protein